MFSKNCPPPLSMPKRAIICKKGHTSGWMYYLLEGMVKVYTTNYNGYDRIIGYMEKHTIFGLDCVYNDELSIVNIESLTDIKVLPFTGDILRKMIIHNSAFAYDFILYYCQVIRQLAFDAENQSINDVSTRLANFLYTYMNSSIYAKKQKIDLSQESLASAINSSRVQVARVCCKFKEDGIIKTLGKGIEIIDAEKLGKLCHI
jgi:CRP-like cAMP-binding protein